MQVNSANNGNFNILQNRNISHDKSEKTNKSFDNKNVVAQVLALNDKEVAPKELIEKLTKRHGENFFDGVGRNDNNEITFGDLDKHLKENFKGDKRGPRVTSSMSESGNANHEKMKEAFGNEKVPQSEIEHIKQKHGENFLDNFKPKDSENITFKELGEFMEKNAKDTKHRPQIRSGSFKSDKMLSNDKIKSIIESELKSTNFGDMKRSDFTFPTAYNSVDISKIFMDVVI